MAEPITGWGTDRDSYGRTPDHPDYGSTGIVAGREFPPSTDTEAALATVREALPSIDGHEPFCQCNRCAEHAALDTLASELERQRAATQNQYEVSCEAIRRGEAAEAEVTRLHISIEGAMARVVELESELADAKILAAAWNHTANENYDSSEDLQARLDRALEVLEEIGRRDRDRWADPRGLARAALAEIEESA